jgi:hypothetical protein
MLIKQSILESVRKIIPKLKGMQCEIRHGEENPEMTNSFINRNKAFNILG